jgi:RNase P subunit RPR2
MKTEPGLTPLRLVGHVLPHVEQSEIAAEPASGSVAPWRSQRSMRSSSVAHSTRTVTVSFSVYAKGRRLALVPPELAVTPVCAECGAIWLLARATRWRLRLDIEDELVWFCPSCDEREFGET